MRISKNPVRSCSGKRVAFSLLVALIFPFLLAAQDRVEIKGYVRDADGKPLQDVSVVRKSNEKGTTTNADGYFSLRVGSANVTLVFSSIGFSTREVRTAGKTELSVILERAVIDQDEVVVIGYGTARRKDLTGAVTTVRPKESETAQFATVDAFLRGRAAGVQVQQSSGSPGGAISIRIRGTNSLRGDNEPLYVVDGVIINNVTADNADPQSQRTANSGQNAQSTLSAINPQDIESIEVLKDASATAIYGSRGANGVVIITTKQGKSGRPAVQFSTNIEYAKVSKQLKMLDAKGYAGYINEIEALNGRVPLYGLDTLIDANWQDELQRPGITQTHRVSLTGASGDSKTKYYLAAGYKNVDGIVRNSGFSQGDLKLNLSQDISKKFNISFNLAGQYTTNTMALGPEPLGSANNSIISKMISANPIKNAQVDVNDPVEPFENPLSWIEGYDDIADEQRLISRLGLTYKISGVFRYKLNLGVDFRNKERKRWFGKQTFVGKTANGSLGLAEFTRKYYLIENLLLFTKNINRNHRLDGTFGITYDNENISTSSVLNENFFSEALRTEGFGFGQLLYPYLRDRSGVEIFSVLGRVNYTMYNKYLVTVSGRADGSSKFASGNKFSYFPSVAAAWKISNEKFFRSVKSISDLKLRVGYGESGNQAINPYGTFARYGQNDYVSGNTVIVGTRPQNIQNDKLRWETTKQFNAGLDVEMLNKRLTLTVDAYQKKTTDLLQNFNIPTSTGYATIPINIGSVENKGIEFTLNGIVLDKQNMTLSVGGNIAFNRNKILDLGLPETQFGIYTWEAYIGDKVSNGTYFKDPANIFIQGQPIGMFYGYQTNGVYQSGEDISSITHFGVPVKYGDVKIVDQDKDGVITPDDKVIIGNPNPKFNYGFTVDFTYGNLNAGMFFNGVYGNQVVNGNRIRIDNPNGVNRGNILASTYYNAWTASNPTNNPRVGNNNDVFIDRYVEDGSFLRLATATVGYTFKFGTNKLFRTINVNLTGRNLFLITKYTGFDPEVNSFVFSSGKIGIDWNSYPNVRALTLGAILTF